MLAIQPIEIGPSRPLPVNDSLAHKPVERAADTVLRRTDAPLDLSPRQGDIGTSENSENISIQCRGYSSKRTLKIHRAKWYQL